MRVACVQANVKFGDPDANVRRVIEELVHLKDRGVELAVFPEAFLTGYCVSNHKEAEGICLGLESDATLFSQLQTTVDSLGILMIVGFAERQGSDLFNTAALFEPGIPARYYRKTHLPELGYDNYVKPGDELEVFPTRLGIIGILICFDLRHPEATRILALKGAELICLPTNWPQGAEFSANSIAPVRACENRVFLATCNRVGTENGVTFIGSSGIFDPNGDKLAQAGCAEETLVTDLDLSQARVKRKIVVPGKYETTVFESRRPDLYSRLLDR